MEGSYLILAALLIAARAQNSRSSLVLLWRRGPAVLTAASLMVTRDERFRLVDGYNLQITDVGPQVHTVEVLVPPSVRPAPESRHAAARRGGAAVLECRAAGNPVPSVTWHKLPCCVPQNASARLGEGPQLQLARLERRHSGRYACTVDNGVGPAIRSWVHTGEGFRAELLCTVLADPPAEVSWYQNSFPLSASERVTMAARGNNHTLLIANVQPEDFGNYSLGRARQHVEVSGRPGPARFTSPPLARSPRQYTLAFAVDSYPPLDELRLLYRQLAINESFQQPGRWHDVVLAAPAPAGALTHRVAHELRSLQPGAVYEAIVQAKNRYGWNEVSDIFQFHTLGGPHAVHADELSPNFSSATNHRLTASTIALLLYTLA
ncbi:hypothetical protein MSG28_016163 [Choristoneura fumiferana]|uniref:Uncharacterized protein n=1 Tax=Choristoneura fumiferana TaxID=7141 RepID=A0ACC0K5P1_CHOFU|nr:hypothetical protein MSG28_016163 [Choristoneura fumiferana]